MQHHTQTSHTPAPQARAPRSRGALRLGLLLGLALLVGLLAVLVSLPDEVFAAPGWQPSAPAVAAPAPAPAGEGR